MDYNILKKGEWGLVLQGGGGKGAYQAGVFKALWEYGIGDSIKAVSGTSVGALNACLFVYPDEQIAEEIWMHINSNQILTKDLDLIDFKEGLFSREGLLDTIDGYIDLQKIRSNERDIYVTVTQFDSEGKGEGNARYVKLNGCTPERIKQYLLASSCMPYVYEPVEIDGSKYRDGGLKDNTPVQPLYDAGIRNFLMILLSQKPVDFSQKYPDAQFYTIRPSVDLGSLFDGVLDFSNTGAKIRYEIGYRDAVRQFEYSNAPDNEVVFLASLENERIRDRYKMYSTQERVDSDMEKLNTLLRKYT